MDEQHANGRRVSRHRLMADAMAGVIANPTLSRDWTVTGMAPLSLSLLAASRLTSTWPGEARGASSRSTMTSSVRIRTEEAIASADDGEALEL